VGLSAGPLFAPSRDRQSVSAGRLSRLAVQANRGADNRRETTCRREPCHRANLDADRQEGGCPIYQRWFFGQHAGFQTYVTSSRCLGHGALQHRDSAAKPPNRRRASADVGRVATLGLGLGVERLRSSVFSASMLEVEGRPRD
jgi:hypothetical protein